MSGTARVVVVAALASLVACGAPTSPSEGRVDIGPWGGDHLRVDVTAAGGATEYDCAHGTIDEPLVADRDGRFSARGTHTPSITAAPFASTKCRTAIRRATTGA